MKDIDSLACEEADTIRSTIYASQNMFEEYNLLGLVGLLNRRAQQYVGKQFDDNRQSLALLVLDIYCELIEYYRNSGRDVESLELLKFNFICNMIFLYGVDDNCKVRNPLVVQDWVLDLYNPISKKIKIDGGLRWFSLSVEDITLLRQLKNRLNIFVGLIGVNGFQAKKCLLRALELRPLMP